MRGSVRALAAETDSELGDVFGLGQSDLHRLPLRQMDNLRASREPEESSIRAPNGSISFSHTTTSVVEFGIMV